MESSRGLEKPSQEAFFYWIWKDWRQGYPLTVGSLLFYAMTILSLGKNPIYMGDDAKRRWKRLLNVRKDLVPMMEEEEGREDEMMR